MTGSPLPSRHWRAELALAGVALIWGVTFVLVKRALADISTVLFLALRFSVAAFLLGAIQLTSRSGAAWRFSGWGGGLLTGGFLYAGYLLQTIGLRYTSAAKSGFLTGLYIVLVPVLSAIFYRRAPGKTEWLGVSVAATGMALMTLNIKQFEIGRGDLLTIGCALAFAIHMLLLGHFTSRIESAWLALVQIGTCALIAWMSIPFLETPVVRWSVPLLAALGITSVLATAVAFYVQTWGQRYTTPTRAAVIFALEPIFAWVTAFVASGERMSLQAAAGAGCILAGILLVELKPIGAR